MPPRVKVLEVTEATTAGVRRHFRDLVAHLDKERFSVDVVCSTLRDAGFLNDIESMRLGGAGVAVVQMSRAINPASDVAALAAMRRAIRQSKPDVVHTHSSKAGFLGRLAARLEGTPAIIHTPHVFPFEMEAPRPRKTLYFLLEKLAARWTDRFICVSRHERDFAVQSGLAPASRFVLIENGIGAPPPVPPSDAEKHRMELGLEPADLVVGAVGRFTPQKGYGYLVLAAEGVVKRFPNAKFILVGDGETREAIESMAARLRLRSHFVFTGAREDALSLYPLFDLFVLPSLWESLPYALLEAMAAGRAIIATQVGGIPEAIAHGQTGCLVPPKDPAALAQAMIELLPNEPRRQALGSAAREVVHSRYGLDRMVRLTETLYTETLDAKAGRG